MEKKQAAKLLEHMFSIGRFLKGEMVFERGNAHLTLLQIQTLFLLTENKDLKMQEIAQHFSVTKPTATSLLKNLVKLGLVERVEGETDRRVVKIILTKKGQEMLQEAKKCREEKLQKLLTFVNEKDRKDLLRILGSISDKLKS